MDGVRAKPRAAIDERVESQKLDLHKTGGERRVRSPDLCGYLDFCATDLRLWF